METSGWWGRLQAGLEKETSALSLSALKPSVRSRSLARGGDKTLRSVPSHPQLPPGPQHRSGRVISSPRDGGGGCPGGAGKLWVHLDFHCCFWSSSPSARAGSRAREVGKQGQATFNGAPLGLPSKDSSSINLVLLVAAHHCKRDHFLRTDKNKVTFSSRETSQETELVSKALGQAVFRRDLHGTGQPAPDAGDLGSTQPEEGSNPGLAHPLTPGAVLVLWSP